MLVRIRIVCVIHVWWELELAVQHFWFIVVVASHVSHVHGGGELDLFDESAVECIMCKVLRFREDFSRCVGWESFSGPTIGGCGGGGGPDRSWLEPRRLQTPINPFFLVIG